MAHGHEKFLGLPPNLNSTHYCYYLCTSNCALVCIPSFPPLPFPFFSPPSPPPPSPPPVSSPPLFPPIFVESHSKPHLSPLVIVIVALLVSAFLLVSYFAFIRKYYSTRHPPTRPPPPPTTTTSLIEDLDQAPTPFNFIWYVRTVGLDESVINSITVCKYKRGEGLIEGTDCSVCLSEFHEGDDLRLLPKCSHAVHIPCIDTWLRSHVNCPLCRANVVTNPPPACPTAGRALSPIDPVATASDGNSSFELRGGDHRGSGAGGHHSFTSIDMDQLGGLSSPRVNCGFRAQSDLIDRRHFGECAVEMAPVRRSVSMDSLAAAGINASLENTCLACSEGSSEVGKDRSLAVWKKSNLGESSGAKGMVPKNGLNESLFKMMSKRGFLQKGPVLMKRSFSGSSKFLLSRYGRSRNAILPL